MAIPLAAIMGGATALNEMTTGRQQQERDARLKANIYRLMAYDRRLNPESQEIYQPDPIGKGMQAGMAGYQLGSNINRNEAIERYLNKGAGVGGVTSEEIQAMNSGSQAPGEFVPQSGRLSLLDRPKQSQYPYSLMINKERGF